MSPTNDDEISLIVRGLKESSAGYDDIPAKTIKRCISIVTKPLTHLVNLSLTNGYFPEELKLANVVPIFKAGEMDRFTNLRPVSILSTLSEIFEKKLYLRLLSFLNPKKGLISIPIRL